MIGKHTSPLSRPARRRVLGALLAAVFAVSSAHGQKLGRDEIRSLADAQLALAIETFREYLSIPNDAHFPEDIRVLVNWLDTAFRERGFETAELVTPGSPLLLAERRFPGAKRTVLFYLQTDGQPVSPADWDQASPYTAVLKQESASGQWSVVPWERIGRGWDDDWRIFARSASDSKGPNIQFLAALDAMESAGLDPDFNIKVIMDTEDEL